MSDVGVNGMMSNVKIRFAKLFSWIKAACMVHIMYTHLGMKNTFIQIKQMFIL